MTADLGSFLRSKRILTHLHMYTDIKTFLQVKLNKDP